MYTQYYNPQKTPPMSKCEIQNGTNDVIVLVTTDIKSQQQSLITMPSGSIAPLSPSCDVSISGVVPATTVTIDGSVLKVLASGLRVDVTPITQLVQSGNNLILVPKGEPVAPTTSSACTFRNASSEFALVTGSVNSMAPVRGVVLGSNGSFTFSACPVGTRTPEQVNITLAVGSLNIAIQPSDLQVLQDPATQRQSVPLAARRAPDGSVESYILTHAGSGVFRIVKFGNTTAGSTEFGVTQLSPAAASCAASNAVSVTPFIQTGLPFAGTIAISVAGLVFMVLFIIFIIMWSVERKKCSTGTLRFP